MAQEELLEKCGVSLVFSARSPIPLLTRWFCLSTMAVSTHLARPTTYFPFEKRAVPNSKGKQFQTAMQQTGLNPQQSSHPVDSRRMEVLSQANWLSMFDLNLGAKGFEKMPDSRHRD